MSVPAAVFASGGGSNFQSLLDHQKSGAFYRIVLLVSDRPDAGALDRAEQARVPSRVIPVRGRPMDEVGTETLGALQGSGAQVLFLAGYLRLVPPAVVHAYSRKILNIHPALLPSFGGKGMWGHHVHEAVLASGASFSGPTIHLVDEEYDRGMILAQWPVPVRSGDTPDSLAARVLEVEHLLYPRAADHLCRAIAAGRPPERFDPPGGAVSMRDRFDVPEAVRQLEAGFHHQEP